MKLRVILIGFMSTVLFVACSNSDEAEVPADAPKDIKKLVDDYSIHSIENATASITSTELIVVDDEQKEQRYTLPEDEFFVSFAPFVNETHPCDIHSLTGCQGEMVEEDFDVYIEDEDGKVIVDETITSYPNGFIDLWLPRDDTFQITITHEDKQVQSEIQTFEENGTCITTFQLT